MGHHADFDKLFSEEDILPTGSADLQETKRRLECALVQHQSNEPHANTTDKIPYWDYLRRCVSKDEFSVILGLASRHSLAWTNKFIGSLVSNTTTDGTEIFSLNAKRLKTLLFLQTHAGLQSRDLSNTSPYTFSEDNDLSLFERPIEGERFNEHLLDNIHNFLETLKDSHAVNWLVYLVKQGFLNFAVWHKKIALQKEAFIAWLTQWATQCNLAEAMQADKSWEAAALSSDTLSPTQQTYRHLVCYGLSPQWLEKNASCNITVDSALTYHQKFSQNDKQVPFKQAMIHGSDETNNSNAPTTEEDTTWIDAYQNPEDQYILRQLREVLSLERLKFYHDNHCLPALIKQVQEGKLSLAEVKEYDTFQPYKEVNNFKDFSYAPRVLPRLLAGVSQPSHLPLQEKIRQVALYDMEDYRPQPNPIPDDGKSTEVTEFFKAYDTYLQNCFEQVILPIAEERARLYEKLCLLRSKNKAQSQVEKSCFGSFDKDIRRVEQKIDILSGFLEEACFELKHAELMRAQKNLDGCKMTLSELFERYCDVQVTFDDYWKEAELILMSSKPTFRQLSQNQVAIYCDSEDQKLKLCFLHRRDPADATKEKQLVIYNVENELDSNLIQGIKKELTAGNISNSAAIKNTKLQRQAILKIANERGFSFNYNLEPMKQNSLYRLERDGMVSSWDIKNSRITRTDCEKSVVNNPDHPVRSYLAYIIGKFFSCTKWFWQFPAACKDSFGWKKIDIAYGGIFYNTRSQQTLFKAKEKNWYMNEALRQQKKPCRLN